MLTMQAMGNVGSDPEIKTTEKGVKLARFSLASNKKVKGEKITTWVNVTVFDERKIDFIASYVKKGTKLFIEGEPQARAYLKDGEACSSQDCILSYGSKIEIASSEGASTANTIGTVTTEQGLTDDWANDLDDAPF
jgi:single-strand DNA-binding protein